MAVNADNKNLCFILILLKYGWGNLLATIAFPSSVDSIEQKLSKLHLATKNSGFNPCTSFRAQDTEIHTPSYENATRPRPPLQTDRAVCTAILKSQM